MVGITSIARSQRRSSKTLGVRIRYVVDRSGASESCSMIWIGEEGKTGKEGTTVAAIEVVRRDVKEMMRCL